MTASLVHTGSRSTCVYHLCIGWGLRLFITGGIAVDRRSLGCVEALLATGLVAAADARAAMRVALIAQWVATHAACVWHACAAPQHVQHWF